MGLFSSKTVVTVGTSVQRLVEDKNIVSSAKLAITEALYSNGDVVDHLLESAVSSIGTKAALYYNYARDHSPYGLPSGEVLSNTKGKDEVQVILDALEGSPVLIDYCRYGPPNAIHWGWIRLISDYGYDPLTNKLGVLSAQKGYDVYLNDMYLVVPANQYTSYPIESMQIWGDSPNSGYVPGRISSIYISPTPTLFDGLTEKLVISVSWKKPPSNNKWNSKTEKSSEVFDIPATAIANKEDEYFHVRYISNGIVKYWMYKQGSGNFPELDSLFEPDLVVGEYFPNVYFRLNKTNPKNNQSSDAYKASKKMMKILGGDYSDLVDRIHENPDIGDVEQAYLTFAVPADTADEAEIGYLYEYFDRLRDAGSSSIESSKRMRIYGGVQNIDKYSISIRDAAVNISLIHDGIFKKRFVGNFGPVGSVASGKGTYTYQQEISRRIAGQTTTLNLDLIGEYRYYRKQIGLNLYDELRVYDLKMKYFIWGNHNTVNGDDAGEICLIPLDMNITKSMPITEREYLYNRAMHVVFNSVHIQKVKWYQQSWFATFIQIVGIVLTVMSFGTDGGQFMALAAAITAGSYYIAAQIILTMVLNYLMTQELFKLFVKMVGPEFAFLVALAAAAYGMSQYLGDASKQAISTAKDFLQLANGLVSSAQSSLEDMYKDLLKDASAFEKEMGLKQDLLEKAENLLTVDSYLNPFVIIGESPTDYFNRTAHSGNIGTMLIDDVHSFYSRSLTLPRITDSIGGFEYGT